VLSEHLYQRRPSGLKAHCSQPSGLAVPAWRTI
jgi:hypothetical protein